MTILEQILAGLQTKFTGVDAAILTRIATKKAEGVTDETKVNSIVEGISFSDVLNSYGDFRAGDATRTSVQNYEKKHNLKDGKPIENPNPNPNPKPEDKKDDVPAWAQALIDSNKNLSTELSALKQEKLQATRQEQILTSSLSLKRKSRKQPGRSRLWQRQRSMVFPKHSQSVMRFPMMRT